MLVWMFNLFYDRMVPHLYEHSMGEVFAFGALIHDGALDVWVWMSVQMCVLNMLVHGWLCITLPGHAEQFSKLLLDFTSLPVVCEHFCHCKGWPAFVIVAYPGWV